MKKFIFYFLLIAGIHSAKAQVYGCTDPKAKNYNVSATVNDGSCTYNGANITPLTSKVLNAELTETSGLILWNNNLWSHNDDTNIKLYSVDTASAAILQSYTLTNTVNTDWEEISQDSAYVYVGDFGNNANGNRTDLHILRVEKNSLLLNAPLIDTIWFSYSNQTSFTPAGANNTDFDCEAFLVSSDSIYLFSKQWVSQKTSIYALPKTPGTYVAGLRATLNVQGLVTGITYLENKRLAVMCGYSKTLQPFFYLLYDIKDHDFLSGNKRKIDVNLPFHQVEGIATGNGLKYYASNENLATLSIPQKLHTFDLSNLLGAYLHEIPTNIISQKKRYDLSIFPNPANDLISIRSGTELKSLDAQLRDATGKVLMSLRLNGTETQLSLKSLPAGAYYFSIDGQDAYPVIKQ